jgi:hypothetical protein
MVQKTYTKQTAFDHSHFFNRLIKYPTSVIKRKFTNSNPVTNTKVIRHFAIFGQAQFFYKTLPDAGKYFFLLNGNGEVS